MKKNILFYVLLTVSFILYSFLNTVNAKQLYPEDMVDNIHWLGHATFKIKSGEKLIYIDPFQINTTEKADIILITHSHHDHLSPDDISKLSKADTVLITPKNCIKQVEGMHKIKTVELDSGMSTTSIEGILIEAVPAYNVVKKDFHPKGNKWVGYILTINGVRIYHAGDTERIPEMKEFSCDIALLPLGQTYTMNSVEEAAEAALDVKAKIAIPMHYGLYEGSVEDAVKFKNILSNKIRVIIKTKE